MSSRWFLLFLCTLLVAVTPVWAQSDDVLPPRVTAIQPLTGVPIATDGVLTITFNQPMVSAALSFQPDVVGAITWSNPLTLTFTPDEAWPIGVDYAVTLTATGTSGVDLAEPVTFDLLGPPQLAITTVSPQAETNDVTADTVIVVSFDRPMVSLEKVGQPAEGAAVLRLRSEYTGIVAGSGQWTTSSMYSFTPGELAGNIRYTVTVLAGLTALDGQTLAEPFDWSFTTKAPMVLNLEATSDFNSMLQPDSDIRVLFNQAMAHEQTEAVVELRRMVLDSPEAEAESELVPVQYQWQQDDRMLVLDPIELLPPGYTYSLKFTGDSQSATGALATIDPGGYSLGDISYAPHRISPGDGDFARPGNQSVTFDFEMPMDAESFRDHYRIEPEPLGEVTPYFFNENRSFSLQFEHADKTTYTVTLLAGIKNKWGHAWPFDISTTYSVQTLERQARDAVQLNLPRNFVTIPTYQMPPALDLGISGQPTIQFDIYRADIDLVVQSGNTFYADNDYYWTSLYSPPYGIIDSEEADGWKLSVPWVADENRLHQWSQDFDDSSENPGYVPLTLADDEPLPLGLYGIELTSAAIRNQFNRNGVLMAVANVGITVKAAADGDSAIWVTDLKTGTPIPDMTVTVFDSDGERVATGVTDAHGVLLVPRGPFDSGESLYTSYSGYYGGRYTGINFIEVTGPDRYGVWFNGDVNGAAETQNYLYTDRPIYRPGETVYFRGVLRDRLDMTYTVPPDVTTAHVQVGKWDGYYYAEAGVTDVFYEADLDVTEFGTVSGSFVIPSDLTLSSSGYGSGGYMIQITACADPAQAEDCAQYSTSIGFEVAEFRVPEFEVEVTSNLKELVAGDALDVDVRAAYYSGGALGHSQLSWYVSPYQGRFDYTGEERGYTFGCYGSSIGAGGDRDTLDAMGQFHIDSIMENDSSNAFRPSILTVEASVMGMNNQSISGVSDTIVLHPSAVYIGLRTVDRFQSTGDPFDVDVLTVTPQSAVTGSQPVNIEVIEHRWVRTATTEFGHYNWENIERTVAMAEVVTGANGYASYRFEAPFAGRFEIVARTQDQRGNPAQTVLWVYARDRYQTDTRVWWSNWNYRDWDFFYRGEPKVILLSEETTYVPGDTAEVLIPNPFEEPIEVLVTMERAGVMAHEAVRIEGDALVYTVDITDEYAPGVWVSVVMIRGGTADEPDPTYRYGRVWLSVEPVARQLNVELTPSDIELAPRDTLSFDVRVTDASGNPVQAEVGLHLTDDAVLALRPSNSVTLESRFYSDSTLRVFVTTSHMSLLSWQEPPGMPGMGGGGGGGASDSALVREDFVYTPLWAPHVVTDADGHATVSVTLPDNLTRWRLDARAVTLDTNIGQAETTVISTLPLIVRPDVPRYFVVGDQLPVGGVINNNTAEAQTVTATLESTGLSLLDGVSVTQTVEVAPFGREVVEWPVIVEDVPGVDLTVYAVAANGLSDAAKPALRTGPNDTVMVYRYTAPETMATAGVLYEAGRAQEGLLFSGDIEPQGGELTVQLESSLVAPILGGLDYLRYYPHYCVEQTVSRFYPNLVTAQLLADLDSTDPELVTNLRENTEPALEKLISEQNEDGGWGWFGRMTSNPYVSAYALLALADAANAGYTVPDETMSTATAFLAGYLADFETAPTTPDYQFNRAAFALYALARAGSFQQDAFDDVIEYRERLSSTALAHLALAAETSGNGAQVVELVNDLVSRASITGTSTYWKDDQDVYNWSSNTRTTATVVLALTRLQPEQPLLPGAIRWLMAARRADHWPSTQETAWTVLALGEWLRVTGELNGEYAYQLMLNGAEVASGAVTPNTIQASQGDETSLRVEIAELLTGDVNLLDISRSTGPGVLYYVAGLNVEWPADEVAALSRGITVERSYLPAGSDWEQIDHIIVGEQVQVRLNITLDQDTHYFVLEDVLPAGLEVLDTNLLTTSRQVDSPRLGDDSDKYWWWWWYVDQVEMRDTGAVLYADYLPRGSYTFTYTVQATQTGTFQAIPAQGYAFYTPEVFGRSDGAVFTVDEIPDYLIHG